MITIQKCHIYISRSLSKMTKIETKKNGMITKFKPEIKTNIVLF